MLKTCSICGNIHDINKICHRNNSKKKTKSNQFRTTYAWKRKSISIRKRDNYICRVCFSGKYDTDYKYNYKQLSVHHIIPLEEDYSKRLDSNNLITLCDFHHKMAEQGLITRKELQDMVRG